MRLRSQSRPLQFAVAAVTASLVLAACSGGDSAPSGPGSESGPGGVPDQVDASWEQIAVNDEAFATDDTVDFTGVIPASGRQPAMVYGSLTTYGEGDRAALWEADGSLGELGLGSGSYITDVAAAGKLTYLVGTVRESGVRSQFLLRSTNRHSWVPQELPDAVAERHVEFSDIALAANSHPVLLGVDADDVPVAVLPDDGTVVDLPMPTRAGTLTYVTASAATGQRVLALAVLEDDDGSSRLVGYRSDDAGTTWELVGAPSGVGTDVAGLILAGDEFVATGSVGENNDMLPMAWSTTDGATWTRERSPVAEGREAGWASWLSEPTTVGQEVYAVIVDDRMLDAALARRSPDGTWQRTSNTPPWITPGAESYVGADARNGLLVARTWNGRGQIGLLDGDTFTRTSDKGDEPLLSDWTDASLVGDEPVLIGFINDVDATGNGGWSRSSPRTPYSIRNDKLTKTRWEPRAAAKLTDVTYASDPEAGTVVLGTRTLNGSGVNESDVVGWFRQGNSGPWKEMVGLAGKRAEIIVSVARIGDTWIAAGYDRTTASGAASIVAVAWMSKDGRRWVRARGDFGSHDGPNSLAQAACTAPDGRAMLVGGEAHVKRGSVPKVWTVTGQRWQEVDIKGLGSSVNEALGCASSGNVMLIKTLGQPRDLVFRTEDGTHFEQVTVGDRRDSMGSIRQVGDGFAATGSIDQNGTTIPVVWMSADGATWRPVVVPTEREASTSEVLERDGDLLVPLTSGAGPELWVMKDVADVVASLS